MRRLVERAPLMLRWRSTQATFSAGVNTSDWVASSRRARTTGGPRGRAGGRAGGVVREGARAVDHHAATRGDRTAAPRRGRERGRVSLRGHGVVLEAGAAGDEELAGAVDRAAAAGRVRGHRPGARAPGAVV